MAIEERPRTMSGGTQSDGSDDGGAAAHSEGNDASASVADDGGSASTELGTGLYGNETTMEISEDAGEGSSSAQFGAGGRTAVRAAHRGHGTGGEHDVTQSASGGGRASAARPVPVGAGLRDGAGGAEVAGGFGAFGVFG